MQARKSPFSTIAALMAATGIALAVPLAAHADPMAGHGDSGGPGCPGHGGMGHGGDHGMGMFGFGGLHGLKLTEEQQDKIFELRHAQEPAVRAKFKELREARNNLEALTRAPTYDEAKVRALTDRSAAAMAELARMHARTQFQIYQILTPDQRKELDERKAQREEMGPGMMHQHPGQGMRQG